MLTLRARNAIGILAIVVTRQIGNLRSAVVPKSARRQVGRGSRVTQHIHAG